MQLRVGGCEIDARFETRDPLYAGMKIAPLNKRVIVLAEGREHGVVIEESEAGRQHADDGISFAIQNHALANGIPLPAEPLLPELVVDNGHGRSATLVF